MTVLATTVSSVLAALLAGCSGDTDQLAAITSWSATTASASDSSRPNAAFPGQPRPTPTIDVLHPVRPPSSSDCPANGLNVVVWVPDAALGLRDYELRGFNCSGATMTIRGYPAIHLLDGSGQRLDVQVLKGGIDSSITAPAPATITLAPGQSAGMILSWRTTTGTAAVPAVGEYLQIVPFAGARSQILALHADLGTTGKIAVTAWKQVTSG